MRLSRIQEFLTQKGFNFEYRQEEDCGSIEFDYRGLNYHIWEFPAPERGAESNVRTVGRSEEYEGDYENEIIKIMENWEGLK